MKLFVIVYLCVVQVFSATTTHRPHNTHHHTGTRHHGTHPTREAGVLESFSFRYDPKTHIMAAMTHHKCYMYSMSATESTEVHTPHGLHTLETKLITMVDDSTMTYKMLTHDEVQAASPLLAHLCNRQGWTSLKLN